MSVMLGNKDLTSVMSKYPNKTSITTNTMFPISISKGVICINVCAKLLTFHIIHQKCTHKKFIMKDQNFNAKKVKKREVVGRLVLGTRMFKTLFNKERFKKICFKENNIMFQPNLVKCNKSLKLVEFSH